MESEIEYTKIDMSFVNVSEILPLQKALEFYRDPLP